MKKTPFDPRIKRAVDRGLDEIADTVERLRSIESEKGAGLSVRARALLVVKALVNVTARAIKGIMDALVEKANHDKVTE